MKIQFCGAARTVTGSCHYVESNKIKVLVDCGAFQGSYELNQQNRDEFPFKPSELQYVFLTHAHFDHCGRLPMLYKQGFRGTIISTHPTRDLTELVLLDSAYLQAEKYKRSMERYNREMERYHVKQVDNSDVLSVSRDFRIKADSQKSSPNDTTQVIQKHIHKPEEPLKPLYTKDDVHDVMKLFEVHPYGESVNLRQYGLEYRMRDAGHILGSAIFELWLTEKGSVIKQKTSKDVEIRGKDTVFNNKRQNNVKQPRDTKNLVDQRTDVETKKLVFSGDLGQPGQRIIRDPDMIRDADYVIVESTYGDRLHKSKDETVLELLSILKDVEDKGGNAIVPTFAVERAQEIIYEMNLFFEKGLLENLSVVLDSPMAIRATDIFQQYPSFYDEDAGRLLTKGDNPFAFKQLKMTESAEASKSLVKGERQVILAGSGMCTGGRVIHHLKNNISDAKNHLVFVGFQVQGTLGREIVDGEKNVNIWGRNYTVNAQVHTLGGFSAHADERDLRYWLRGFGKNVKQVFVVHGQKSVAIAFAGKIAQELGLTTEAPKLYESFEL